MGNLKFGCCTNMLPRELGSVGEEYLPILAELGYDYVELPLGDITTQLTNQGRKELKSLVEQTLPAYSCNNFMPASIHLCGENPTPFAEVKEYCRRALYYVAELGAPMSVFGSPWSKSCPEGFSKEEAFRQLVEFCSFLGEEASKYEIMVAIEPNNRLETNMINTYSDVIELVRAVKHPNIQGLQDYFHLKQEQITVDSMIEGKEHLVHTHFAKYEGRRFPKSVEEDPYYQTYFQTLKDIGYVGGVSMEGFLVNKEDFANDASATLSFFKEMERM